MLPVSAVRLSLVLLSLSACNGTDPGVPAGTGSSETGAGSSSSTATGDPTPTTSSAATTGDTSTGEPGPGLASGPLQAGAAMGHITGPVGASMAGYGGRTKVNDTAWNDVLNGASGFYGYGTAKAIALEV